MKVKTSITLASETLQEIDRLAVEGSNRSRVIEQAVLEFVDRRRRLERERRELETLNSVAEELNEEMSDVLAYQGEI